MPPFRTQWESHTLVAEFLAGRDAATDPLWAASGAATAEEYGRWAAHLCGCACLQMAVAAGGQPMPRMHDVRRGVQSLGGYVEDEDGGIRGLIYAGAVAWLGARGFDAAVVLDVAPGSIAGLLDTPGRLLIASVHPQIREPDAMPPSRGGHLVLVFGVAPDGALRFHNPSGFAPDARLAPDAFGRFHAGRGILMSAIMRPSAAPH